MLFSTAKSDHEDPAAFNRLRRLVQRDGRCLSPGEETP
jgi:hypothetical protein